MKISVLCSDLRDGWLYDWFVRYNPLFFFSALCVLLGMYMVTSELPDWYSAQLILAGVMHGYEICLITGAALLFRIAKKRRPAVILGLAATFFLFDPTLRNEGVTALGPVGFGVAILWMVLVVAKLAALRYAFRLTCPAAFWMAPVLSAFFIAVMPYLFASELVETQSLLTMGVWIGAAQLGVCFLYRPEIGCQDDLDDWGDTVRRRATRAVPVVWAGFYVYHLIAWMGIQQMPLTMHVVTTYLALIPLMLRREDSVWISASVVLGFSFMDPSAVANSALALGVVLACVAWRKNLPRIYLGAVLCLYLSAWTWQMNDLVAPDVNLVLNLLGAGAVLLMGWRYRLYTALPAAVLCLAPGATAYLPHSVFQWGVLLLVLGFIKLFGGFAINWYANDTR